MKHRIGKKVGEHVYYHISVFEDEQSGVPSEIWKKIQKAQALRDRTPVVSTIPDCSWNLVKVHQRLNEVTFLWYPDFFVQPHPGLERSLRVVPGSLTPIVLTFWRPDGVDTPILHRKELFLTKEHSGYRIFADLTAQEEKAGLYASTSTIGRLGAWKRLLEEKGLYIREHVLYRKTGGRV